MRRAQPAGWVYVLGYYLPSDWGNSQALAASERVRDWTVRADHHRERLLPGDAATRPCRGCTWFWVLEWNRYMRIIVGISYDGQQPSFMRDLPELQWVHSRTSMGAIFRSRQEQPLDEARDDLFDE